MASLSPILQHFVNKASESNFALWNALLTVNGIMLTAFSILPMVYPAVNRGVSLLLVACCFVSLLLMIWNFWVTKEHYLEIGRMLSGSELTEEQRKVNIKTENRQHRNVRLREKAALLLLVGESVLIVSLGLVDYITR
jgi:Na+/melibiose symporter-like transporter